MCNFSLALSETISLWKQNGFNGSNVVSFSKSVWETGSSSKLLIKRYWILLLLPTNRRGTIHMSGNADISLGTLSPFWHKCAAKSDHLDHVYICFSFKPRLVSRVCAIKSRKSSISLEYTEPMGWMGSWDQGSFRLGDLHLPVCPEGKKPLYFPPRKSYF